MFLENLLDKFLENAKIYFPKILVLPVEQIEPFSYVVSIGDKEFVYYPRPRVVCQNVRMMAEVSFR